MSTLRADIRQAVRRWIARPGLALTAILTLALGIGTTTAIFSLVDGVLLRPLPYADPGRLVTMWTVRPQWQDRPGGFGAVWNRGLISWLDLRDLEEHSRTLAAVGVWTGPRPVLVAGAEDLVVSREISSGLLPTLGVSLLAGRNFTRQEEDGPNDVAMVTYQAWQRRFGGDASIVGRRVTIDGQPRTIVGVLPRDFRVEGEQSEMLLPIGSLTPRDRTVTNRNDANRPFQAIARLKPGVSIEAAATDVEPLLRAGKDPALQTSRLEPLADLFFGGSRRPMLLLLGASGLLLLIACANVTGLLLGDVHARRHELAVRHALGAGAWRVIRQLLAESVVLAASACVLGVAVAWWLTPTLGAIAPATLPRIDAVGVDSLALAFALAVSLVATVVAGVVPAMMRRDDATETLRGGRVATRHGRTQGGLVAVQVALALVLLAGAGLLGETVVRLSAQPLGFEADGLVVLRLPQIRVPLDVRIARRAALLDRLRNTPGVEAAAAVSAAPFTGSYGSQTIEVDNAPGRSVSARRYSVSEGYFQTMQMPLARGREFVAADVGGEPVVVVSRELERRYLDGNALGRRVRVNKNWMTVVGVVPDAKLLELSEATEPAFYLSAEQNPTLSPGEIVVRTRGNAAAMLPVVRRAVLDSQAASAIWSIDTAVARGRTTIAEERYRAALSSTFGVSALVLAAIGLYGLLARRVAEQRREIGVRMAVGARPLDIIAQVAGDAARLVAVGLAVGVPAALAASRLLRAQLFGVDASAPHVFVLASAVLVAAALVAAMVPASRAGRVDPIVILRAD